MRYAIICFVNFYNAGIVTHDRKIGSLRQTLLGLQVFKTFDKEEFLNVLSGDKKSVKRSGNFESKKSVEPQVKNEDTETW
jgi:hypothetical protein